MDLPQSASLKPVSRTHKFGGSSLADAARIRHVADLLIADDAHQQIAVTSAMQGTTNALIALSDAAAAGNAPGAAGRVARPSFSRRGQPQRRSPL